MALLETNSQVISNIIKHEYPYKHLSRETIELEVGEGDRLQIGNVVGKVTIGGEYKIAKQGAGDGSEKFYGVIVGLPEGAESFVVPRSKEKVTVVVLSKAPAMINPEALILDTSYTNDGGAKKKALLETIVAKGIDLAEVK